MKKIGFLSFGHWTPLPQSQTRSAADALLQSIDLAVAAEELGADGAYFRVHHFARQLASPFPLLAAVGAKTSRIEIGTAVIDMRYENPLYMAEDAGAADLIAGGAATRDKPWLPRAGDRWMAPFRLPSIRRPERCRYGPTPHRGFPRSVARQRLRAAEPTADVPKSSRVAARRASFRGPTRSNLVGSRLQRHCGLGCEARNEPSKLNLEKRRDRRAVPRPAGRTNPRLPRRLEGGRPFARAAGLSQPEHLCARR